MKIKGVNGMDNEMREMFQLLLEKIDSQDKRFDAQDKRFDAQDKRFEALLLKIDNYTRQVNLKIENDVSKRIDALFDGYKLTHEKQWELERKVNDLERRLEKLENAG